MTMTPSNALSAPRARIDWIDRLKGLAFFFVILGHLTLSGTVHLAGFAFRLPLFKSWIYSFHMPLFFFVTGFTYDIDKIARAKASAYLSKLIRRMLVPYLWMELLSVVIQFVIARIRNEAGVPMKHYIGGIIAGNNHLYNAPSNPLYFILLLFLAEVLLFFIVKLVRGNRGLVWTIVLALLPATLLTQRVALYWHANCVPGVMFMILLGTVLRSAYQQHEKRAQTLHPLLKLPLCLIFLAAGAVIWHYNGRIGLHGNVWGKDFTLAMLSALASTVGFAFLMMMVPQKERLLCFVGKNTLFYMGLHKPILLLLTALFPAYKKDVRFTLVAAVFCYLILVPVTLLTQRVAPFVLGKPAKDDLLNRLGQMLCIVGATCVPYQFVLAHFRNGMFLNSMPMKVLACGVYVIACAACYFLFRNVLRFPFLLEKKEKRS